MEQANSALLKSIDKLIRAGQTEEARASLSALVSVERPLLAEFCSLLRRVGELPRILRLLNPIVRPGARQVSDATAFEIVEYAGALVRSGILTEAEALLASVDVQLVPRALLIGSFAAIARWDSARSNSLLERFLALSRDEYERRIAEVNLLQGYVFLDAREKARAMIAHLLSVLAPEQKLLRAAVCEFAAEIARVDGERSAGRAVIAEGLSLLEGARTIDELLLRKQGAINEAWFTRDASALRAIREAAVGRKHIETVRDCDLFIALVSGDQALLRKVYFGSASSNYRERVRRLSSSVVKDFGADYSRFPSRRGVRVDVVSGRLGRVVLKRDQAMHRLLRAFASEQYKPFRKLDLFEAVFPGEIYFPAQSSDRVHQLLKRLRSALSGEPIQIVERAGVYRLKIDGAFTLSFAEKAPSWAKSLPRGVWFGVGDVMSTFSISERSAQRRIAELRESWALRVGGRWEERGTTKSKRYRLG